MLFLGLLIRFQLKHSSKNDTRLNQFQNKNLLLSRKITKVLTRPILNLFKNEYEINRTPFTHNTKILIKFLVKITFR